jgi:hypothetical protein
MIQEKPADRFLDDEIEFIIVKPARSLDPDYELRHPGHGDQSVHSPHKHKGGGAAVASDLAAGREVTVAGRDLPDAFDAMANGDGGVNLNRLSTTDGVSFAATGVKVPRAEMPQVPGSKKAAFIAELDAKGVKSTRESVDPKSLKPIQSEISGQKSGQMLQSMRDGKLLEGDNPLIVSRDGFVVDGHHRWAAAVARSYEVPVALPVLRIDMDAVDLLAQVKAFADAEAIPARLFDRAADFDYEFRHPGHPDQSVHNPHKGGGAPYAPGAWKPATKAEMQAVDKAVLDDLLKERPGYLRGEGMAEAMQKDYLEKSATGEMYTNGNVRVRFPEGMDEAKKQELLRDVDQGLSRAPEAMLKDPNHPIDINVTDNLPSNVGGRHVGDAGSGSIIEINLKTINDPIGSNDLVNLKTFVLARNRKGDYGTKVKWHAQAPFGTRSSSYAAVHEIGHSVGAWTGGSTVTPFSDFSIFAIGKGKFTKDLSSGGGLPWANRSKQAGFISKYATKNSSERYAEHYAAWVFGATDSFTKDIADLEGWR